jgi:hypothetical protein
MLPSIPRPKEIRFNPHTLSIKNMNIVDGPWENQNQEGFIPFVYFTYNSRTPDFMVSIPKLLYPYSQPHRLSINRRTKRGKEKYPSDRHCQREKEMDDHLLACQQILEREQHSDTCS